MLYKNILKFSVVTNSELAPESANFYRVRPKPNLQILAAVNDGFETCVQRPLGQTTLNADNYRKDHVSQSRT